MTYFPDLSPYSYLPDSDEGRLLNIGWLDVQFAYSRGRTDQTFIGRLLRELDRPFNRTRGFHRCNLCGVRDPIRFEGPSGLITLGDAEIHVKQQDGSAFASPNLLVHYVLSHDYCPPDEYIEAIVGTQFGD